MINKGINMKMKWIRCLDMYEAIAYSQFRKLDLDPITPANDIGSPENYAKVISFTDGTAIACCSRRNRNDEPSEPKWWIGIKIEEDQNGDFILVDW